MGYCTNYNGEIVLSSEIGRNLAQVFLQKDNSDEHGTLSLGYSKYKDNKLILNEDSKFYDSEIEQMLILLAKFDKGAKGIIISEGEDGENKKRFSIMSGKVYEEEGFVAYKNKHEITNDFEFDDAELNSWKEKANRFSISIKCEKCGQPINLHEFDFSKRGYYELIKEKTKFQNLDEKCYRSLKKAILEIKELEQKKAALESNIVKKKGGI